MVRPSSSSPRAPLGARARSRPPLGGARGLVGLVGGFRCPSALSPSPTSSDVSSLDVSSSSSDSENWSGLTKVSVVLMGCSKNTVDAEVFMGHLEAMGRYVYEPNPANADAVIVNTCSFVEEAKRESIDAVLDAAALRYDDEDDDDDDEERKVRRDVAVLVTGCMAQRYAGELASLLPEVDAVVGFEEYEQLSVSIDAALERQRARTGNGETKAEAAAAAATTTDAHEKTSVRVGKATVPFREESVRTRLGAAHTAYLRVAEGCDHTCTFCSIPSFRGSFRSKPFDNTLDEAASLVKSGARELCLIAEDTNQYGSDWDPAMDSRRLSHLLEALSTDSRFKDLQWIRLLYCYPSYFTDELVDAIASLPKVLKHIDIPLQHASESVLRDMRRPSRAHADSILTKLRAACGEKLTLRSTFISGFPGETEQDHLELLDYVRDVGFARGGCFPFSEEEGTAAADAPLASRGVDRETVLQRHGEILDAMRISQENFADELYRKDELVEVMVDGTMHEEDSTFWRGSYGTDADAAAKVFSRATNPSAITGESTLVSVGRTRLDSPAGDDARVLLPGLAVPLTPGGVVLGRVLTVDGLDLVCEPVDVVYRSQ